MCIVFFEWTEDRFLVCHNRDEWFSRPTASMAWWKEDTTGSSSSFEILAPRDVVSGGTWFGFEKKTGRCAFLTNIRELDTTKYSSSRGEFVVNYLKSDPSLSALEYLQQTFGAPEDDTANTKKYAGFNLVVFSGRDLAYISNRYPDDQPQKGPIALSMGRYGLSNSILQEPYAKVRKGLELLDQVLDQHAENENASDNNHDKDIDAMMQGLETMMQNGDYCPGDPLPRTGDPGFPESTVKNRSSICVPSVNGYGTRTTIRFLLDRTNTNKEQRLRCVETNWNEEELRWETSLDLNCTIGTSNNPTES